MKRLALVGLAIVFAARLFAGEPLPWEKDYAAALAKGKGAHRPLFLMLTATWCGPCKMLEGQTLPAPAIRGGLEEFVWVKAYEDKALNERFHMGGYPTLVFLDSADEQVLEQTSGYEPAETFLRHVIAARRAGGLPLTEEMKALLAKVFSPDETTVETLIRNGDAAGLIKYLAPVKDDALRECNYLVAKLRLPPDLDPAEIVATAGGEHPVPASGVLVIQAPRGAKTVSLRIVAPGCKAIDEEIGGEENTAVAGRELVLERLSARDAASFSGRVLRADGQPAANAIVRICDWDVTHADSEGRFEFARVTPGTFTVRGEAPGGEIQNDLTFAGGQQLKRDLRLKAVTTVGIRWALQRREGSRELTGEGVRTGEAYFSVEHSRFLLSRGAQVRQYYGSDFMLMADWKGVRQYLTSDQIAALEAAAPGTPIFWLFDMDGHPNGLHAENARFEEIRTVNSGKPDDEKTFFKFVRGEALRKGAVYTLRCTLKNCYAKMEITDVTLVPDAAAKRSGE